MATAANTDPVPASAPAPAAAVEEPGASPLLLATARGGPFAIWAVVILGAFLSRPPTAPIELETLSTAWHMLQSDTWVPLINGEIAAASPPLHDWLIPIGWQVFGMAPNAGERSSGSNDSATPPAMRQPDPRDSAAAGAGGARRVDVATTVSATPANDAGSTGSDGRVRQTRVYATSAASGAASGAAQAGPSRTRGIGNRFRPVQSRALARTSEMSS